MSQFLLLGLAPWAPVAGPSPDLFPGRWVPMQVGIVRCFDEAEGQWATPKLEIILEWQPETPDRLRFLSIDECRQASEHAAERFSPTMWTFVMADGKAYHARASTTAFRYGGSAEVRMIFPLPESLPETLDLFVEQSGPVGDATTQPFAVSAPPGEGAGGKWQTGPFTWSLAGVQPGADRPGPHQWLVPGLDREFAVWSSDFPVLDPPDKVTRLTLTAAGQPLSVAGLHVTKAALRAGENEWPPLRITRAEKRRYALTIDPAGRARPVPTDEPATPPYLILWFPVPDLPGECELALEGVFAPTQPPDTSLEQVYTDLPIPLSAP